MKKAIIFFLLILLVREPSGFCEEPFVYGKMLKLDDVLQAALSNEPRIRMVKARLDKEKALREAVKRGFFPKLRTELYGALTSQSRNSGILFWTSEIRFPVFEGGRRLHELAARSFNIEKEKLQLEKTETEIFEEIRLIYIAVIKEKKLLKISQKRLKEIRAYYEIASQLVEKELMNGSQFLSIKTMFEEVRFEHLKHKEAMDYGESLLRDITGLMPDERILLEELEEIRKPDFDMDQFMTQMRGSNPNYKIAGLELEEKYEQKKILSSERFPKLSFTGRFQVTKDNYIDQNRFEAGILGSWNIWDFGVLGKEIKAKEYEIIQLKEEGNFRLKKTEVEARKMISDLKVLWGKLRYLKTEFKEKKRKHHDDLVRLMTGDIGKFQILDSLASLTDAQIKLIETAAEFRILEARLETIKGGKVNI